MAKRIISIGTHPTELEVLLDALPYTVLSQPLEDALDQPGDACIVSMEASDLNVWQCLRLLSSLAPVPRLVVSGVTPGEEWIGEAFRSGAHGVLFPPFSRWRLLGALGELSEWDPLHLDQLQAMVGIKHTRELLGSFLETLQSRTVALYDAIQKGAAQEAYELAHSLKTSAGNMGAKEMMRLCDEVEAEAQQGALPLEVAELLDPACRRLIGILEAY